MKKIRIIHTKDGTYMNKAAKKFLATPISELRSLGDFLPRRTKEEILHDLKVRQERDTHK